MSAVALLLIALVSISAIIAVMLAVAWLDFGRPRHAATWAAAFATAALAWGLALFERAHLLPAAGVLAMPALLALASALVAVGFRQRAGLPAARRLLIGLGIGHGGVLLLLAARFGTTIAWIVPLATFNAAMFWLASRTLHGRRRSERLAERVAEAGLCLLAVLHLSVLAGIGGDAIGLLTLDLRRLGALALLLLPSVEGSIGLYTIILITADLADRTRRLTATDLLTGLLNRRGFEQAAAALLAAAARDARPVALVMIDIDHFKDVNDRFGHPAGDRVLRGVCQRIGLTVGRRDLFARIGGEEFAVVLADVDLPTAACAVEVMRLQVETLVADLPVPHRVTASFGLAAARGGDDLAALLRRADQALYRSKEEGRNRVTLAAA